MSEIVGNFYFENSANRQALVIDKGLSEVSGKNDSTEWGYGNMSLGQQRSISQPAPCQYMNMTASYWTTPRSLQLHPYMSLLHTSFKTISHKCRKSSLVFQTIWDFIFHRPVHSIHKSISQLSLRWMKNIPDECKQTIFLLRFHWH